jgi:hypothetical protein
LHWERSRSHVSRNSKRPDRHTSPRRTRSVCGTGGRSWLDAHRVAIQLGCKSPRGQPQLAKSWKIARVRPLDKIGHAPRRRASASAGAGDGAVDGGARDREQLLELADGVRTSAAELDKMGFLSWAACRAAAPCPGRPPFPLGTSKIGLELGDHRQGREQQPSDRIGRAVHRAADVQLHSAAVSSSTMSRASGTERASRSSLVTTRVSPRRQAAKASRRQGRSRLVPVR